MAIGWVSSLARCAVAPLTQSVTKTVEWLDDCIDQRNQQKLGSVRRERPEVIDARQAVRKAENALEVAKNEYESIRTEAVVKFLMASMLVFASLNTVVAAPFFIALAAFPAYFFCFDVSDFLARRRILHTKVWEFEEATQLLKEAQQQKQDDAQSIDSPAETSKPAEPPAPVKGSRMCRAE